MHTVSYRAADVAGNLAPEESVSFKIDGTAPELALFEPQTRSDPRLVAVAAADRTSGLADGARIDLRRVAPTLGAWIALSVTRRDGHYYAHINNAILPEGDYEFRATIPDQAGNQATAVADRAGAKEVVHITPTRIGPYSTITPAGGLPHSGDPDGPDANATVYTKITAWAVERVLRKKKCIRRPRPRRRTRCPRPSVTTVLVHDLRVPFGRTTLIKGALATAAGKPIRNAEVTVLARSNMAGGEYRAEGSISTNSSGTFTYRAPAGAGRMLDFHYRGDATYKHADDQVALRVAAALTINSSRYTVKNGQLVRFSGRLKGRPYPSKGKVLDLQAYYRGRWRTFATPRAASNGNWSYRYRFQATRGSVAYKFRVHARATSDYPYEAGYSKAVRVVVTGP
jgi:hypothetical protein